MAEAQAAAAEESSRTEDIRFTTDDGHIFKAPTIDFDGPLDLLLYMIQQSQVNIYDIPIAQITDEFLVWLDAHKDADVGKMSAFYRMAAQLLRIKSMMLLPQDVEYDEDFEDPRQELVNELIEFQKYKKYTQLLSGGAQGEFGMVRRENDFFLDFTDTDLFKNITLEGLCRTFRRLMENAQGQEKIFNVYESVTVNEKITLMDELLESREEITLDDVIVHPESKEHIVCAFMAILFACRWKKITIRQEEEWGTITIRARHDADVEIGGQEADTIDDSYDRMIETGMDEEDEEGGGEPAMGPLHEEMLSDTAGADEEGNEEEEEEAESVSASGSLPDEEEEAGEGDEGGARDVTYEGSAETIDLGDDDEDNGKDDEN